MLVGTPGAPSIIGVVDLNPCLAHGHMHGLYLMSIQPEQTAVKALRKITGGAVIHGPRRTDKILHASRKKSLCKVRSEPRRVLFRAVGRNAGLAGIGEDEFGHVVDPT